MSLAITCAHCKRRLDAWPVDRCPRCEADPHVSLPDDTAEHLPPPADRPPPDKPWEDADVVEE